MTGDLDERVTRLEQSVRDLQQHIALQQARQRRNAIVRLVALVAVAAAYLLVYRSMLNMG